MSLPPTPDVERQKEALIKKFTAIAKERAAKDMKLVQWVLDYIERGRPRDIGMNAEDRVHEANILLSLFTGQHGDSE